MSDRDRAAVLREAGLSYREIGHYLGVSAPTVIRWLNPGSNERSRAMSRAWKERNRDVNRARDRQRQQDTRDPCPTCGTLKFPSSSECEGCVHARAAARRTLIEGMWADGWTIREIGAALGVDFKMQIGHLRLRDGYDLPYRYGETHRENMRAGRVAAGRS